MILNDRSQKMRKTSQSTDHLIKALAPKDADIKYMGDEPAFVKQPENRIVELSRGFTWYNRFYTKKDAKELFTQYLDYNDKADIAKQIRNVPDSEFVMTLCWLSRMSLRGLQLLDNEQLLLQNEITRLLKCLSDPETKTSQLAVEKVEKIEVAKPNIQDYLREKAVDAAGELEGMFDNFMIEGAKASHNLRPMDELARKNVVPQYIYLIADVWKKKLVEFEDALEGKDSQLVQGYQHLTKTQLKNTVKFIESVLGDLNSYINVKKANKAPRKKKAVPVEKIVSKLKYLKELKDAVNKLELVSVHPSKLHGASEAWAYDSNRRKLHHYIADEYSKVFTVKGNTLLGFDTVTSEIKTLRKPKEQIKEIMGSKPAARKFFKDIKSVATKPNGRFNQHMIILKAF